MSRPSRWLAGARLALGLLLVISTGEAMATLGQAPMVAPVGATSVGAPVARQFAASSGTQSSLYTVHELLLDSGTSVLEYATPAGLVFAVSWHGPVLPDLSSLLGSYFPTFKWETEQARSQGKRGSPVNIERDDLVVRSSGRMRDFFGHAYAPALIPTGVEIKNVLQ